MDQATIDRIMSLPLESSKRREILECFGCYSMSSVMLRVWKATEDEKEIFEFKILSILGPDTRK
jgi:hypothetical protein